MEILKMYRVEHPQYENSKACNNLKKIEYQHDATEENSTPDCMWWAAVKHEYTTNVKNYFLALYIRYIWSRNEFMFGISSYPYCASLCMCQNYKLTKYPKLLTFLVPRNFEKWCSACCTRKFR